MKRDQFWSKTERLSLLAAIRLQRGAGRWDRIAATVGTRTPSQCRKQWERLRVRLKSSEDDAAQRQIVSLSNEQEELVCHELELLIEGEEVPELVEKKMVRAKRRRRHIDGGQVGEEGVSSFDEAGVVDDDDLDVDGYADSGNDEDDGVDSSLELCHSDREPVKESSLLLPQKRGAAGEGRRIEHAVVRSSRRSTRANQLPPNSVDNPFQLVDLEQQGVLTVEMAWWVMLVIDLHAHLSRRAEVIGLLGGVQLQPNRVRIDRVHPCRSVGTEIECEMDPVSEMHACQQLAEEGRLLLGWYHSHPTFRPSPSLRDLETQAMYQRLLVKDDANHGQAEPEAQRLEAPAQGGHDAKSGHYYGDDGNNGQGYRGFVGIIVSPWATRSRSNPSDWECFHLDAAGHPQRCPITLIDDADDETEWRHLLPHLLADYPQADLTVIRDKLLNRRDWNDTHLPHLRRVLEGLTLSVETLSSSSSSTSTSLSTTTATSTSSSV